MVLIKTDSIVDATIDNIAVAQQTNLEVFSGVLQLLAETDKDIIVVTSDSRGSGKLVPFGQKFPDQIIEVGIAEQNLVGVSAGIASTGKKVFAVSPACFLTARALEQIKNDVAYSNNPVTLVGISAGVSYGALGSTHHSLHDFAVLRTIHNLIIVAPADNFEAEQAVKLAAETDLPVYIRFGKKSMPLLSAEKSFEFGKGRVIREGSDLTIIATGETVEHACRAARKLEREYNLVATVVSMHTIKPLDYNLLSDVAAWDKPIITVEEHSVYGGLGEACASFLIQNNFRNRFKIIGIPDEYTVTGSQQEIFNHYGISEDGITQTALALLG
ncbi:transketolase family protein [Dyadobacter sp. LJ53]|uniref:transketolase family protein n=1 Tax=Dyadobacter chenwenxiniae TaxID=2906456 RepID=UPI001F319B3F|nr:transketolase C-terminal domain-containing protein [Dyadobacter chenwenxiniae]MCF0051838.1 transketolase family protein [Dyadobacter chenwenxiniae]